MIENVYEYNDNEIYRVYSYVFFQFNFFANVQRTWTKDISFIFGETANIGAGGVFFTNKSNTEVYVDKQRKS